MTSREPAEKETRGGINSASTGAGVSPQLPFLVGGGSADITPPLGVGLPTCATFRRTSSGWLLSSGIGTAIRSAVQTMRPCCMPCGTLVAEGLAIHRQIRTTEGILLSHPEPPEEIVISREGAVDHAVRVSAFLDETGRPRAVVVNAACHPVHEICLPHVSPDYPGIMSTALERQYNNSTVLFLNGAAGNVNPPTVSGGPQKAERHGMFLAERGWRFGSSRGFHSRRLSATRKETLVTCRRTRPSRRVGTRRDPVAGLTWHPEAKASSDGRRSDSWSSYTRRTRKGSDENHIVTPDAWGLCETACTDVRVVLTKTKNRSLDPRRHARWQNLPDELDRRVKLLPELVAG